MPSSTEVTLTRSEVQEFFVSVRRILVFNSEIAGQILRGELQPQLAYEVLGPQIARNGGTIREMMENQAEWVSFQPGLQLRVLALIDLMWAEGARIGELETQPTAKEVATHKRTTGSGKASRKRTAQLVRRVSHKPFVVREWKILQLTDLLRNAEKPNEPLDAPHKYEVFVPSQTSYPDLDWSLDDKNDDIRVVWLQTALNSAADGKVEVVPILRALSHLQDLRKSNPGSFRWWENDGEEE